MPTLFDTGEIVTDYISKDKIFNNYFVSERTTFDEDNKVFQGGQ